MTHHQAKRPYGGSQPHITSYFPLSSPADSQSQSQSYSISQTPQDYESETRPPHLPAAIQSNLLSVGMRVRKSVPEGYKTGTEYSAFQLFAESNKGVPTSQTQAMETPRTMPKTRPRANAGAGVRELMPFCGLLKVGGMNTQQWGIYSQQHSGSWSRYDSGREEEMNDEDEVPFLSSQGSTISTSSVESVATTPNGNKRRCEWEDSGEDESVEETEVTRERPVVLGERVLAVPRRRRYQGTVGKVGAMGQENRVFGDDMDFGEADFLDMGAIKGGEIEMGGV